MAHTFPRPASLVADERYRAARRAFSQRTGSAETGHVADFCRVLDGAVDDAYATGNLLANPAHSLRQIAHQMHAPFRTYGSSSGGTFRCFSGGWAGVQPYPALVAVQERTFEAVRRLFSDGSPMERDLKIWMSRKGGPPTAPPNIKLSGAGISLSQRSPGFVPVIHRLPSRFTKHKPYRRGSIASSDVLGKRVLLSPPAASFEYLERELQQDAMQLPREMIGQAGFHTCSKRQFNMMKVQVAEAFNQMEHPLRLDTQRLAKLSGVSKLQIEEMRRQWWRECDQEGNGDASANTEYI